MIRRAMAFATRPGERVTRRCDGRGDSGCQVESDGHQFRGDGSAAARRTSGAANRRSVSFSYALGSIGLLWASLTSLRAADVNVEKTLTILQARDAQFDNVRLQYVMSGTKPRLNKTWRRFGAGAVTPAVDTSPLPVAYEYRDDVIVRGSAVTFRRDQRDADISRERPWTSMIWNNFDGIRTELVLYDQRFTRDTGTLEVFYNPITIPDGESRHRMWIEFALGFGFGKRLTRLDSVEERDTGWEARGEIRLWRDDVTSCVLTLDDDYIVRSAVLDANVNGNLTHIETRAAGTVERNGFLFAEDGHYLRRLDGRLAGGERIGKAKIDAEYDIRFVDATFQLTDDDYRQLTRIDVPIGVSLVDPDDIGVAGIKSVTWAAAEGDADRRSRLTWFAILNGLLTAVLLFLWLRAKRKSCTSP